MNTLTRTISSVAVFFLSGVPFTVVSTIQLRRTITWSWPCLGTVCTCYWACGPLTPSWPTSMNENTSKTWQCKWSNDLLDQILQNQAKLRWLLGWERREMGTSDAGVFGKKSRQNDTTGSGWSGWSSRSPICSNLRLHIERSIWFTLWYFM